METKNKLFMGLLELRGQYDKDSDKWNQVNELVKLYFKIQQEEIEQLQEKLKFYEGK